ncbi:MAG: clan AA aspartic protease [Candidatus Caldarchaeum sp.]
MSGFINSTPIIQLFLENPLLAKRYPVEGYVAAVVDTGYEGFLAVPNKIFHGLALDRLHQERRTVMLANGVLLTSTGTYATIHLLNPDLKLDGFVETYPGLDEILVGTEMLTNLRIILDYCTKRMRLAKCV